MGQVKRVTAKKVVAEHFGTLMSELGDYLHSPQNKRMFSLSGVVFAATPDSEEPHKDSKWKDVTSDWDRHRCPGWRVWELQQEDSHK